MTVKSFSKTLSANDTGATDSHQAGILVPKTDRELLAFLPSLDPSLKNPDAWISCVDENGDERKFRFVYYNNRFHDPRGTRNEYRITHMTGYMKTMRAMAGDGLEISKEEGAAFYRIRIVRPHVAVAEPNGGPVRIRITAGWRRIH